MRKTVIWALLVVGATWWMLMVAVLGCDGPVASRYLPVGATNVTDLGNKWWTFELEVDGKRHKFLYQEFSRGVTCCEIAP